MINRMYFAFTYLICFSPNYKKKKKRLQVVRRHEDNIQICVTLYKS